MGLIVEAIVECNYIPWSKQESNRKGFVSLFLKRVVSRLLQVPRDIIVAAAAFSCRHCHNN